MSRLARAIASAGGIGFVSRAPGTLGSAAALLAGAALLLVSSAALTVAVAVAVALGAWAIRRAAGDGDPGWVVIDEVAGQWIAMLPLARPTLAGCLLAFALFRLFDIAKPGPVGWVDRRHGPWAVLGDDLVAGALAAACVAACRWLLPAALA